MRTVARSLISSGFVIAVAGGAFAQTSQAQPEPRVCGALVPQPSILPPADSSPLLYLIAPCFEVQGNRSVHRVETYLSYIHLHPSRPSLGEWVPFDEQAKRTIEDDSRRLWASGLLRELNIEVKDYTFANGVVGKLVIYNIQDH
jgi:hypothetical protein